MKPLTKEEIEAGVNTIRALRELANNDQMRVDRATGLYKPKYRTGWSYALNKLGVIKKESDGSLFYNASYWNQREYPYDYNLLMAITQVAESKAKESNKKQTKKRSSQQVGKRASKPSTKEKPFIEFDHLSMTKNEYDKLCDKYGDYRVDEIIQRIQNYKKNKNYKSLYLTACNWLERDFRNNIPGYWDRKENGALNDEQKDDLFSKLEGLRVPKPEATLKLEEHEKPNIVDAWENSKTYKYEFIEPKEEKPKTKWLKIFGIKIYEKPVL